MKLKNVKHFSPFSFKQTPTACPLRFLNLPTDLFQVHIDQGTYSLEIYYSRTHISPAAPSIVREDVSLPPPFLRRQAVLTKRKFSYISPFSKKQNRVIEVVYSIVRNKRRPYVY